jgi:hypothetical protein
MNHQFHVITNGFLEFNHLISSKMMEYFVTYEFSKRNTTFFLVGGSIIYSNELDSSKKRKSFSFFFRQLFLQGRRRLWKQGT